MTGREEIYRKNIEGSPLHNFLGIKIEQMGKGEAKLSIPSDSHTLNPAGSLHGGVIYLVSDVASFAALGPSLEAGEFPVTIDIQCSVYRGTKEGPVFFQAKVATRTRRLAFINVEVRDAGGVLLAETRVTKAVTGKVPEAFR